MSDPYATHLPILQAISQHLTIRRVLEFGIGHYSTAAFMNRGTYPDLAELVSVETNPRWCKWAFEAFYGDCRHEIFMHLPDCDLSGFDLIFIDDGMSVDERATTIQMVSDARPQALVVIHDFEQLVYQSAAVFDYRRTFTGSVPWTAVLWNGMRADMEWVQQ